MGVEFIIEFFTNKFPFNKEGLQEFAYAFKRKTYKKGSVITLEAHTENQLRFLESGIIREYYSHHDKEMNTWFYMENEFVTDFNALFNGNPRKKVQECLTDTTLLCMDKQVFLQFMERYQCGRDFVHEIFQEMISLREEEEFKHFSLTPDDLYLDLLKHKPHWLQNIPLYHIATYLRMTPETLSRIRKRN